MDYRTMSDEQLNDLKFQAVVRGNLSACAEISDFKKFYGKRVKVVKGKKLPLGTEGKIFWLKRYGYGKYGDPWGTYSYTKVGIEKDDGERVFTYLDNIEIVA